MNTSILFFDFFYEEESGFINGPQTQKKSIIERIIEKLKRKKREK